MHCCLADSTNIVILPEREREREESAVDTILV